MPKKCGIKIFKLGFIYYNHILITSKALNNGDEVSQIPWHSVEWHLDTYVVNLANGSWTCVSRVWTGVLLTKF